MLVFEKNGHLFVSGGYYLSDIPDAKNSSPKNRVKAINKAIEATVGGSVPELYDMYSETKKIRTTYCYVKSKEIANATASFNKKVVDRGVACLAHYIVECLSSIKFENGGSLDNLDNSIICYKIDEDRYGYVLIKDGTIHPSDGDLIQGRTFVKDSILNLINKHNKSTNIERRINTIIATEEMADIENSILSSKNDYNVEFYPLGYSPDKKMFIYNSDDIFWNKSQLKKFNKAKFRKVITGTKKIIKTSAIISGLSTLFVGSYLYYQNLNSDSQIQVITTPQVTNLINSNQMIDQCFRDRGQIFLTNLNKAQYSWSIDSFKCDQNGLTVTFSTSDTIQAPSLGVADLEQLYNNKKFNISVDKNNKFELKQAIHFDNNYSPTISKNQEVQSLAKLSDDLGVDVRIDETRKTFTIQSNISPMYLMQQGYLNNFAFKKIEAKSDQNGGYSWIITGNL